MAVCNILLFFVLLGSHLKGITTHKNGTVNIAIFYNASDPYIPKILQNAEDMFLASGQDKNQRNERPGVYINWRWIHEAEIAGSQIGLEHSLLDVWNISSRIHGGIFVDINSNTVFLSAVLERSAIPTVGIFQSREQPRTQVRRY